MKPAARVETPSLLLSMLERSGGAAPAGELDPGHLERALYAGARAFLSRPGKALRARLIETAFMLGGGSPGALPAAALEAVELLHAGSLIIDDIQDDAELRRGGPALHREIGVPRALNTGNWLYFVALGRLDELPLEPGRARELSRLSHACLVRCHEGQALDLALRVSALRRAELPAVVRAITALKTGALTGFAAQLGATLGGAPPRAIAALGRFGHEVGIALQMLDDLGGCVCASRHHKALEDLRAERASWMWAWASEALDPLTFKQLIRQLAGGADLEGLRARLAEALAPLGRARVSAALADARVELADLSLGEQALAAVRAELANLETSYG